MKLKMAYVFVNWLQPLPNMTTLVKMLKTEQEKRNVMMNLWLIWSWLTLKKTSFVNCTVLFGVFVIFFGRWKIEILHATGFGPHGCRPQGKKGAHQERHASLLGIYVMNLYFEGTLFAGNYGFVILKNHFLLATMGLCCTICPEPLAIPPI